MCEKNLLENVHAIHFVGIGGSGMCPLAEILHTKGYALTGSDNNESDNLKRIRALGIPVHMGHAAENIKGADMVVYTAAVSEDNPESPQRHSICRSSSAHSCSGSSPAGSKTPSPSPARTARPRPRA